MNTRAAVVSISIGMMVFGVGCGGSGVTSLVHTTPSCPTVPAPSFSPIPASNIVWYLLPSGEDPAYITAGPDGKLWFTESNLGPKVANISTSGAITRYPVSFTPTGITTGPDNNLWFPEDSIYSLKDKIGRITPGGALTEFAIPTQNNGPGGIAPGPDGNLWFVESGKLGPGAPPSKVGRVTTGGIITEFSVGSVVTATDIAQGPGGLWFTEEGSTPPGIGSITTGGAITQFPGGGPSQSIVAGPDGNLWFTELGNGFIGRMTPDGCLTQFALPNNASGVVRQPLTIVVGPDGNLWFTSRDGTSIDGRGYISKITPSGTLTEFLLPILPSDPPGQTNPTGMTVGPDSNLWFTENSGNAIGKFTFPVPK